MIKINKFLALRPFNINSSGACWEYNGEYYFRDFIKRPSYRLLPAKARAIATSAIIDGEIVRNIRKQIVGKSYWSERNGM